MFYTERKGMGLSQYAEVWLHAVPVCCTLICPVCTLPCLCLLAEAQEQLLNAKVILRSYNELMARRDPKHSAKVAVAAAGG